MGCVALKWKHPVIAGGFCFILPTQCSHIIDLFLMKNIDKEIIGFIDLNYNAKKYFIFGSKKTITLNTSIRDDLKLVYEDCEELMERYFKLWHVDSQ